MTDSANSQRLDAVIADCLQQIDAGRPFDRNELLEKHPDLKEGLEEFFRDHARMIRAVRLPSNDPIAAEGSTCEGSQNTAKPVGLASADAPLAGVEGRYFGDYELLEEIACGGMGVIYKAKQIKLNRLVALKMILTGQWASLEDIRRFHVEAEAAATLDHPGIVPIYEVGEYKGQHYFSMAYVPGGSLAERLGQGPLPVEEAAAVVRRLAEAMAYAHSQKVIHRDLKPANVLLAQSERAEAIFLSGEPAGRYEPKITDFGLARMQEAESQLTGTGQILGTPCYMPPEQASGRPELTGPLCDVYSLGAILFCLLTGRPPFQAANPLETLRQLLEQEPLSPRQLNAAIPRDLETICLHCLRKKPAERYRSASELAAELGRFLAGVPILARPVGNIEKSWRWCRRNPLVAGMLALIICLLLGITAASLVVAAILNKERLAAKASEVRALAADREKTEKLWQSYLSQAHAFRWSGRMGRRFSAMDALQEAARIRPALELRNEAVACMPLMDLRVGKQWTPKFQGDEETSCLVFNQDLTRYARSDVKGNISIRRVEDDQELTALSGSGVPAWTLRFSPDGRQLVVNYHVANTPNRHVVFWDLESKRKLLDAVRTVSDRAMAFTPDGSMLVLGHLDRTIRFYDRHTGDEVRRFTIDALPYSVRFAPQGTPLAISSLKYGVRLVDAAAGTVLDSLLSTVPVREVAWHPEGKTLAMAGGDSRIYLWNSATRRVSASLEGHTDAVTDLAFNRRGNLLASTGWDTTLNLWSPEEASRILSVRNFTMKGWAQALTFSPDDRMLAYHARDGTVQLWEVAQLEECFKLLGTGGGHPTGFSPDGQFAAVGNAQGVRVWDLVTKESIAFFEVGHPSSILFRFHEDRHSVIIGSHTGVFRWTIDANHDRRDNVWRLPSPEILSNERGYSTGDLSPDGHWFAGTIPTKGTGVLLNLEDPTRQMTFGPHKKMFTVSFSPDGQYLVTTDWLGEYRIKIWNAHTGKHVTDIPGERSCAYARFTPDGKHLVTVSANRPYEFWESGSWKKLDHPLHASGKTITISPDGTIIAIQPRQDQLRLIHLPTGRELVTLIDSYQISDGLTFSPDGSRIAASTPGALLIWDLRKVREKLRHMHLDWDLPAYSQP